MIEIEGPDGVVYEFPAGTADATIKSAMGKVYGAPQAPEVAPQAMPQALPQPEPEQPAGIMLGQPKPERGIGQRIYDNIIGDPTDGVTSTGEKIGTWLGRAGESATLGVVGDEASAALTGLMPGRSYEGELDRYRQNEKDLGLAGQLSADIAGALVPGAGAAGMIGRAGSLPAKIGLGLVGGGSSGATYGFMEGEGEADRKSNAATQAIVGSLLGAAIPAAGAGVRAAAKGHAARKAISDAGRGAPSADELRALGRDLYRQVDEAGVQIKPETFDQAKSEIREYLRANTGFDELPGPGSLTPNTSRVMEIMDQAGARMAAEPTAALPFRSVDQMRRQAGAAAGNVTNKADQQAGMTVIEKLDEFVQGLGPKDVVDGDPEALKSAIGKAREVWSRMSRSQLVDDAMGRADNYLSGSASGLRNQFKNILNNPKLARQFTEAEKAALRQVTHGSALDQMINLVGGGLGQLGSIGGGFAAGGPIGAVLGMGAAAGQRKLSEAVTQRAAERARAAIASGNLRRPDVQSMLAITGQRPERLTNSALIAALLAGQQATP